MPPASVHHIVLQTLAFLTAAGVVVGLRAGTGRAVIRHRGRLVPVAAASAVVAITLSITFEEHTAWIEAIAFVAFVAASGVMLHLSTRWDSYLSLLTQCAATWSTFGVWMVGQDLVHAYSTGGAFWQPWNSLECAIQLIAGVFFATMQLAAIRGARTMARRPETIASAAVVQRDGLGALHRAQAR